MRENFTVVIACRDGSCYRGNIFLFMNTVVYNSLTSSVFCDISRQYFTALSLFLGTGFSRVITAANLCTVKRANFESERDYVFDEDLAGSVTW